MARITIDSINQELSADGWKVISTEYKNLDSELEFMCDEGHIVRAPYKKIRARRDCPICRQNQFKNVTTQIVPKKKDATRVLALDQATHTTGFSIFDGHELVTYNTFQTTTDTENERIHEVNMWLINMINNWKVDIVGIEGIQYQEAAGVTTFQALARLQGVLIETCTQLKIPFEVCSTNTWRAHCGVKGRTRTDKKKSMQLLVKQWFDVSVSDDCADAIGIGKYVSDKRGAQIKIAF